MAWRPSFLAYSTYNAALGGGAVRRFDGIAKHYAAVAADVLLKWALHDCLWYFLGLSAVLIEKDYLTLAYIQVSSEIATNRKYLLHGKFKLILGVKKNKTWMLIMF